MLFFFYGTLVAGSANAAAQAAHRHLKALGAATTCGRLHGIADAAGWYPALTVGDGTVHGQLYETRPGFGAADLAALDAFENFDPARPGESDYLRQEIIVHDGDGRARAAQAYLWRLPIPPGSPELTEGDFAAWLLHTGRAAYR